LELPSLEPLCRTTTEPLSLSLSLSFSLWSPLTVVFHPYTVVRCPKTHWAVIVPCFQAPRVSQSQITSPCSWSQRWGE
jgi:hypothetical protein